MKMNNVNARAGDLACCLICATTIDVAEDPKGFCEKKELTL